MPRKAATSRPSTRAPASIDAYLAGLGEERRATLAKLRATILATVPRAEECISYGMPAFRVDGAVVAGFLATSGGCSYYPFSGTTLDALAGALEGFRRTRSALHFAPDRPLPVALVRKLLRARLAELPPRGRGAPRRAPPVQRTRRTPRGPTARRP